ncbi:CAV1 [Bugula neritina]|uniref:Caveolin n=1 Tax=Bugula neritina TaxID=10212 RepID=A0A7J7JT02_BUGNE|nr:CAV1 [Bugula neritina]
MGEEDGRPDMVNRDPNGINNGLMAAFEEVFGEPENLHSPECAWKCGFQCYEGSRKCCYAFITAISTWCAGLTWGCCYAMMSCCMVWWATPSMKLYKICTDCCTAYYTAYYECCLVPITSALGACFSRIKVTQG